MEEQTRAAAIKRYLAKPPKQAALLLMQAQAEGTQTVHTLGEWPVDEAVPGLTADILAILDDHAAELNAAVVAQLVYRSATGANVGPVKVVRRTNPNATVGDTLASGPEQLTGDYVSQSVQAQKHLEVMAKLYLGNMQQMFALQRQSTEHVMELCDSLAQRVVESEHRERRVEKERDEYKDALDTVVSEGGEDSQTDISQANASKALEPYLPSIIAAVMKMLTQNAGPSAPIPPPG